MLMTQTLTSNAIGSLESMAATVVQASVRGYLGRGIHIKHEAAMVIQEAWRSILAEDFYHRSMAATQIQKHCRAMIYSAAYQRFLAARRVQNCWRTLKSKEVVLCMKAEKVAATAIQGAWRGYMYCTSYKRTQFAAVKAQSTIRLYLAKKKRVNAAAVAIQKSWRGFYAYTCFLITLSEILRIQSLARKFLERRRFQAYNASVVQNAWRGYSCASKYADALIGIIKIQSEMRRTLAIHRCNSLRIERGNAAAVLIQKTWKCYFCRSNYTFIISDVIRVQTEVRRFLAQKLFFDMWEKHAIKSALKIQTRWRCYFASTNYLFVQEDVSKLQAIVRGFLARNRFLELFGERCQTSALYIQKTWRMHKDRRRYCDILSKVCLIQQRVRYYFAMREIEEEASVFIQKSFRSFVCRSSYLRTLADVTTVQAVCRRCVAMKQYRKLSYERSQISAMMIQAKFRSFTKRSIFVQQRDAALDIQRYWRGFNDRIGLFVAWKQHIYKIHNAALQVQKVWRGYVVSQRYLYALGSAIELQSLARMVLAKVYCRRQHESAAKIQALRRRFLAKHVMLDRFSKQSYVRSQQHAAFMSRSVLKIQKAWRRMIKHRCERKSAVIIHWFSKFVVAKLEMNRKIAAKKILRFFLSVRNKQHIPELVARGQRLKSSAKIQSWYPVARNLRERKKIRAGRIILRFFQTIKAEVDKEIEMELQRRKQRKVQKKKHLKQEDKILETAWEKASRIGLDQHRRRRAEGEKIIQETLDVIQSYSRSNMYSGSPRVPCQEAAPPMLALADALEDQSCAQSSFSQAFNRPSPSRVESFSEQDFDEDYCLEEAFLDAEIHNAKSRRKTEKRHKGNKSSRKRTSGSASVASRASVSSRVSVSSRYSTGTRESRDTKASRESGMPAANRGVPRESRKR